MIEYLAALLIAGADTGHVRSEQTLSIYLQPSISQHSPAQRLPPDRWFGEDKFKHFAFSYMITVGGFAGARFVAGHDESVLIGAGVGLAAGIVKELYDQKANRSASWRDLLWDAAGVATGLIVAAHTR